ncbi:hypothetical protein [Paludifilum halophilum]|uniref:Lipoprotein n=1 Tax=Paludifilum halophilum TaxID=1642702 RepID=A0A235B5C4_9BACL|nr:hypothetical protein [Paludifilum halophilum]OYD07494.1 hypothetical protein CHM34_11385 [Paludifilum halophilum]
MARKWIGFLSAGFMIFLLTGCAALMSDEGKDEEKKGEEAKAEEKKEENEEIEGAQAANETFEEIEFQPINWIMGAPDRQPKGGFWVYTKEKHPGNISDSFDWDQNDVLLVQISDKKHYGKKLVPKALQVLDDDVVKVVVKLDEDGSEGKAPRRYIKVDKGALDGKKFIVETQDGERLTAK